MESVQTSPLSVQGSGQESEALRQHPLYQIVYIDHEACDKPLDQIVECLKARLPKILEVGKKLQGADWIVRAILTGIECIPAVEPDKAIPALEQARQYLQMLGIADPLLYPRMLTHEDLKQAYEELLERAWYHQALTDPNPPPSERKANEIADRLDAIEAKYGKDGLRLKDEFQRGFLLGKLAALQWVVGVDMYLADS